ncbi:hypothetical protein SAMN02799624_00516 [Paenibacillus sp. UNC496MF]|uniref:hypothetical protein n=1 Tax=Paenibacillus sp. UNC496MF TaxID=1502753 RepID=UPI0008E0F4BD|nr:hypothetical protein [Paenibacillus sp. UNC496MF]SFI34993.1 hypothetical protein SAMN02799624_00516 [Paenibacillus sp. UNC496MF]
MNNAKNEASKADVQSSELNKLPVPGQDDTEFSAEEAAEAFQSGASANRSAQNEEEA